MMADLFKEIIPSITIHKKNVFETEEDYKTYVPYIVNKALSAHMDCILQANEMNMKSFLSQKTQYTYYINSIRGYKRKYQEWLKREKGEDLDLIKEYYSVSYDKAKTMRRLLSDEQMKQIKSHLYKGGKTEFDENE